MRKTILIFITLTLLIFIATPVFSNKNELNKSQKIAISSANKSKIALKPTTKEVKITKKQIIINPAKTAYQGDTVSITVKSPKTLKSPYFTYRGKKINLYKTQTDTYRGFLGLSAFEKTGKFKIYLKDVTNYLCDSRYIDVKIKKYPIQNIKLSGKSGGITATRDELRRVGRAKSVLSSIAYWDKLPFTNPTKGCISSIYGLNRYYNGIPGSYHKGVDVAAPNGQKIVSTSNGKVLVARQFRLHGGTVAIDHGQGIVSMYLHMSKINIKEGQMVKQGQKIGEVGSTGISTGPHLHWGLYINGTPVDPLEFWVKQTPKCS